MKAAGIKLAKIDILISDREPLIEIKAKSVKETPLFPQIDNIYRIEHNGEFLPLTYYRIVKQKNVSDEVTVNYKHNAAEATMSRLSDNSLCRYKTAVGSQDVYSFLAKVISGKATGSNFPIDANGVRWQAKVKKLKAETISTSLGKYPAKHYEITFQNLTERKMPYIDMVTFNMLQENIKLNLWVYNNQYAVKATFKKNGLTSSWELIVVK